MSDEPMEPMGDAAPSPLAALRDELESLRARLRVLVSHTGMPGVCKGCGARIYWLRHQNGANTPYDPDGVNHFASCPRAESFKRRRRLNVTTNANDAGSEPTTIER